MKRPLITSALAVIVLPLTSCSAAPATPTRDSSATTAAVRQEEVARFDQPWAIAFAPGTTVAFVTERAGRIRFIDTETRRGGTVTGVPTVDYGGQGGLGDIAFLPGQQDATVRRRTIYLSWVEAGQGDTRGAVVGRGTLVCERADACRIDGLQIIWRQDPKVTGRGHYSHRLLFSEGGKYLYIASGERQKFTPAQDMGGNLGKIVRLLPDGSPAPGNPFTTKGGITAQIWTLGHRNILGMAWDAQGRLWEVEHGPAGGDELNLVQPGHNYGWPQVSNGDHYDGRKIARHATRPDLAAPALSWTPVIGPGGMIIYRGNAFPAWRGQALVAGLVSQGLVRVDIKGEAAREVERIPLGARTRAITEGPNGTLWALTDGSDGKLIRLTPR